ncbi:hypothetical protein P7K49_024462 [Saguinus oedipus]|uniref:Uncharacterized protein n=1 Tax=Saguinus oedipus TaxID=9490 RepID=A0ABQ9UPM8_SAGOE|nr:hypothetical protein P7K49_024462 [Saguinus oedipus]
MSGLAAGPTLQEAPPEPGTPRCPGAPKVGWPAIGDPLPGRRGAPASLGPCTSLSPHTLVSGPPGAHEGPRRKLASADPAKQPKAPKFPRNIQVCSEEAIRLHINPEPGPQGHPRPALPRFPARPRRARSKRTGQPSPPKHPGRPRPCGLPKKRAPQSPQVCEKAKAPLQGPRLCALASSQVQRLEETHSLARASGAAHSGPAAAAKGLIGESPRHHRRGKEEKEREGESKERATQSSSQGEETTTATKKGGGTRAQKKSSSDSPPPQQSPAWTERSPQHHEAAN